MITKSRFSLVVAIVAGGLFMADATDAHAKGNGRGRKGKAETVRMARPAGGGDADAGGSITITRGGAGGVLHAKGLDARATYEIVDGSSGDVLGTMTTNRRGKGTFTFGRTAKRGKGRADSADGTEAELPDEVDVVDPETGDPVLEGDTTGDLQYLLGYATLGNGTESVTITMGSDPSADSQYFTFSYIAPPADDEWYGGVHDLWLDTAAGDELPLGAESVLDLAGKDFQVRDANGDIAFRGSLPDVEAYSVEEPGPCPGGDYEQPFDVGEWGDLENGYEMDLLRGVFGGGHGAAFKKGGKGNGKAQGRGNGKGRDDDPSNEPEPEPQPEVAFTLWIESGDGFAKAGDLVEACYGIEPWFPEDPIEWDWDWSDDWSDNWVDDWGDDWNWSDDWGWDWEEPSDEEPSDEKPARNAGRRGARRGR